MDAKKSIFIGSFLHLIQEKWLKGTFMDNIFLMIFLIRYGDRWGRWMVTTLQATANRLWRGQVLRFSGSGFFRIGIRVAWTLEWKGLAHRSLLAPKWELRGSYKFPSHIIPPHVICGCSLTRWLSFHAIVCARWPSKLNYIEATLVVLS
jgi:hypothetical protein